MQFHCPLYDVSSMFYFFGCNPTRQYASHLTTSGIQVYIAIVVNSFWPRQFSNYAGVFRAVRTWQCVAWMISYYVARNSSWLRVSFTYNPLLGMIKHALWSSVCRWRCLTEGKEQFLLKTGTTINLKLWGKLASTHLPYQIMVDFHLFQSGHNLIISHLLFKKKFDVG